MFFLYDFVTSSRGVHMKNSLLFISLMNIKINKWTALNILVVQRRSHLW